MRCATPSSPHGGLHPARGGRASSGSAAVRNTALPVGRYGHLCGLMAPSGGISSHLPAGCQTAVMALYGLTGAFLAAPGKRDELVAHMLEAADLMGAVPGCLLYLVSTTEDADEVAITELWIDEAAHDASLQAPGVGELIARARPVIAGMSGRSVLTVLGGKGLPTA